MPNYAVLAWQPLLRPPAPDSQPSVEAGVYEAPLRALTCRNQVTSLAALIVGDEPTQAARLEVSDLTSENGRIPADSISTRLVGTVWTPEAGTVCDPLYEVEEFSVEKCAAVHISVRVPLGIPAGIYRGTAALKLGGVEVAANHIEVEVANVDLPDVRNWNFLLNVWMNPAPVARWHGVELFSEEHFRLLRPYVEDLASHGQKVVIAPICYRPWGTQTRDPYPNSIRWVRRGGEFSFDFATFDRYVELHESCGIDRAIHCYTIVQGDKNGGNTIEFFDADAGEIKRVEAAVGDRFYTSTWGSFLRAFVAHLDSRGWLDKTYIAFDERRPDTMKAVIDFLEEHAPEIKIALAGNTEEDLYPSIDDLAFQIGFNERGVAQVAPPERSAMGIAQLLNRDRPSGTTKPHTAEMTTSFYVCCGPAYPNTFLFSPLVESRMLPWLAVQGGYDGFLRWSYNDWPDDPYSHPEWGLWPTGDVFFVYPGAEGPVSSLRWEQLREGIADYELAMIASANLRGPEEMVDYEQAITLACRDTDGRAKSVGDIEIARRLLIPIAEHQAES
ncbi:MAG: DUF4091 domain-containing protein [Armatimonadota bacterium]